jgi:hypothetical protein
MRKITGNMFTMILIGILATLFISQNKKKDFEALLTSNSTLIEKIGVEKNAGSGKSQFQKTVEYRIRNIDVNDSNVLSKKKPRRIRPGFFVSALSE